MRKKKAGESWVIYLMPLHGNKEPAHAVCSQEEWKELELVQPGFHKLLRAGILNEGEAERLARGTSGDSRR